MGICASACALAWLAGRLRYSSPDAKIGFHAPTQVDDPNRQGSTWASALVGGYLRDIAITSAAVVFMTEMRPDDMNWLSAEKARSLGIQVDEWR